MNKRGATLIEFIVTISVIAIIVAATSGIIVSLMQLFVYLPREMKTRTIAHEVMNVVTEGEVQKLGMRYAMQVQDASPTQFIYTFGYPGNTDKRNMKFRWDSAAGVIYRSYTAFGDPIDGPQPPYSQEEAIPYYARGEIAITGTSANHSTIFTFYKSDGSVWSLGTDPLNTIRRVDMTIVVKTGSGLFESWESSFQTTSSVEIKQYI